MGVTTGFLLPGRLKSAFRGKEKAATLERERRFVGKLFQASLAGDRSLLVGSDIDAATIAVEVNIAVHKCVQGVVLAHADVFTGMPFGAALADDDVARDDGLATKLFDAETIAA
jgi:hypothetical protein